MDLRIKNSREMLDRLEKDPKFLERVVTVDESWIYHYDPATKQESSCYRGKNQPSKKKVRQAKSVGKVMLIAFFDHKGMIYQHYVPHTDPRTTINKEYYIKVIKQLREHLRKKRPEIAKNFILHQDNATPHTAALTRAFFTKFKIEVLGHPPYSPDMAPCDFWLFPRLKAFLRGHHFQNDQEARNACASFFLKLSEEDYHGAITSKWVERWKKCISYDGHYFEKEKNCTPNDDELEMFEFL